MPSRTIVSIDCASDRPAERLPAISWSVSGERARRRPDPLAALAARKSHGSDGADRATNTSEHDVAAAEQQDARAGREPSRCRRGAAATPRRLQGQPRALELGALAPRGSGCWRGPAQRPCRGLVGQALRRRGAVGLRHRGCRVDAVDAASGPDRSPAFGSGLRIDSAMHDAEQAEGDGDRRRRASMFVEMARRSPPAPVPVARSAAACRRSRTAGTPRRSSVAGAGGHGHGARRRSCRRSRGPWPSPGPGA